ncbi:hypothetical protein [Sphingopyxis sp. Root1497]|uniref:hypothetical protein n=1 Tax=Sphingopyxis sp. Root1497 TaxID=1736474 RepID=UPI0012E3AFC4|nr:hypothetical protein [Sphingopyxis sp. Root1497]
MSTEELVPNSVAATMAVSNSAFAALWPVYKRKNVDETRGYSEFLQWRAHFAFMHFRARHLDRILVEKCHDALKYDDLLDDERKGLLSVIDMFDAISG